MIQSALKLSLQVLYWVGIVLFVQTHGPKMNFYLVCKYLTIGTWIVIAQFFFFNFIGDLPLIVTGSRNSVVFTMIALIPFHAYYFQKRLGSKFLVLYLPFCIVTMLATEGRAGAVLVVLESLLIGSILIHQRLKIIAKLLFLSLLALFLLLYNKENSAVLAGNIRSISPRIAEFVEGQGQAGNLTKDESWLTRRLMIEKGKEIIEKYPFFGVGLMNFSIYEAKLTSLWHKEYAPLQDEVNPSKHFNKTSAHNSYLQIWAETGYIGFVSLMTFLIFPLTFFSRKFIFGSLGFEDLPLISLCCVCLHFYVISIITSALSWAVIGFAYAAYRRRLVI
jgi:O-antigen ligase